MACHEPFHLVGLYSSAKKRKLDLSSSFDGSHNSSAYFSPAADTSRLETDVKRLEFERDSAKKVAEMERLQIDEELRQRKMEEQVCVEAR